MLLGLLHVFTFLFKIQKRDFLLLMCVSHTAHVIAIGWISRSNMAIQAFDLDLDDPMTHPSGPLFQF